MGSAVEDEIGDTYVNSWETIPINKALIIIDHR